MHDRSFVITFLTSFFLLLAGIALFNYTVDAACLYSRIQVLERITDDVLSGKIIAGNPVFQYRFFQRLVIEKRKDIPGTIVIGSSRSMVVRAPYLALDPSSFFNHSVPSATLNDYIALLGCYREKRALPETIILGIDPFVFDEGTNRSKKWKPLMGSYYYLLSLMNEQNSPVHYFKELLTAKAEKALQLLSYNYTAANYYYFKEVRERGFDYKPVNTTAVDDWLIAPDGSLYRPFKLRFQDDGTTRKKITRALNTGKERYHTISFQQKFTRLIDYLLENGSRVVFFLPPYPPPIYQACVRKAPCTIARIEAMLRSLARTRNIPVYGSYDPGRFNLSIQDFIDQSHARNYVVEKIFKEYPKIARE
jgi:hypothetical protein